MVEKILNSKARTITLAAVIVGLSTLVSGLLGVLKMRLLAGEFDVGFTLDSYFAAFRIPDLISATIITGGIIVSFLPLFSQNFQKKEDQAWDLANNMINISFIFLVVISIFTWIFAPQLVSVIAPGFSGAQKELTINLARIMFVSPIIFAISAIFSGILQHFDRFFAYAIAPILYNVGIIFGILFLADFFQEPICGVAWGVVIGALMHLGIQIPPAVSSGYRYRFRFKLKDPEFAKVIKLIGPRMISQASSQLNLIVITAIGSLLTAGSIALFNFANNLYLFPVAIIGTSFATAAFPSFSRSLANGDMKRFIDDFFSTVRQILFIMIPASAMIFILRAQIVRLTLGTGEFGWTETRLTAATLGIFTLAMIFASLLPLIVRVFFSFQDTKTPAIISVVSIGFNIALSFLFISLLNKDTIFHQFALSSLKLSGIEDIRIIGLAAALSIATFFQFIFLSHFLRKKIDSFPLKKIGISLVKTITGTIVMALVTYISLRVAVFFVQLTTFKAVFIQLALASSLGVFTYLATLYLLDSDELKALLRQLNLRKE